MRIAVIHSFYRSAVSSGENNTVLAQVEALRGAGHEVKLIAQYTDENRKRNPLYPLKAGLAVATGNGYDPTPELEKFQPDVVRVHNLFPNFGTKWLEHWRGPVMATLHNYRPVCANGVLFRDGATCTLCPDGQPLSALKYGCYKNSRLATAPLFIQIRRGLPSNPLVVRSKVLIALSHRSLNLYVNFGIRREKLILIPNFVPAVPESSVSSDTNRRWVVHSRLSSEKGVRELIKIWPEDVALDVYGSGPGADTLCYESDKKPLVHLKGELPISHLMKRLGGYEGAVFSSLVWETFGRSAAEAMMCGLPVIAFRGSSAADEVERSGAGIVVERDAQQLQLSIRQIREKRKEMSSIARAYAMANYGQKQWLDRSLASMSRIIGGHYDDT